MQPCVRIFASATFAAIKTQAHFGILDLRRFDLTRVKGLPSWTLDFTLPQQTSGGHLYKIITKSVVWTKDAFDELPISVDPKYNCLTVMGTELDQVSAVMSLPMLKQSERADSLSRDLADFFQTLVRSHAGSENTTMLSFPQSLFDFTLEPELLQAHNPKCNAASVSDVLQAVFLLWNLLTNFSGTHNPRYSFTSDSESTPIKSASELYELTPTSHTHYGSISCFEAYAEFVSGACQFFATKSGFIGLAPITMNEGDKIVLVKGCQFPMILRQVLNEVKMLAFRGFVWVHGIWEGELVRAWKDCDVVERRLVLV